MDWLESDNPKCAHDVKGPLTALLVHGVALSGLICDTAVAAYLVAPGGRDFELAGLVQRYLGRSLAVSYTHLTLPTILLV